MRFSTQPALAAGLLVTGLFLQSPAFSGSQRMSQEMAGSVNMERGLPNTNESLLMSFLDERDALIRNRANDKNPHLLKNKIKILNGKIDFLAKEIKRTKPYAAPVVARIPAVRTAPAAVSKPKSTPVLKLKGYAPTELRARHFLAWASNFTKFRPYGKAESRLGPQEAVMPKREAAPVLEVKAPAKPAETKPVELRRVETRPAAALEARQNAQREKEAPRKVVLAAAAPASDRAGSQEHPLLAEALMPKLPESKTAEMRSKAIRTGADWKKMSQADKEIYILSVMGNLSKRDVYLMKPYSYYIQSVDQAIAKNPDLENEFVHRILMMTAYESEPDTRKDLEKVWK